MPGHKDWDWKSSLKRQSDSELSPEYKIKACHLWASHPFLFWLSFLFCEIEGYLTHLSWCGLEIQFSEQWILITNYCNNLWKGFDIGWVLSMGKSSAHCCFQFIYNVLPLSSLSRAMSLSHLLRSERHQTVHIKLDSGPWRNQTQLTSPFRYCVSDLVKAF